ncbi:uncharacterized protein TM35_000092190 [Trypanosoma theileri]|uniref:Uncharacterized protein n=1 Tax=Trypanosoma theileri TaxID=67003 RepID=A0A1X0P0W9_9TRYP|nr:uncharacterized protein TM35_000092190 [Trypanosoma theileri]ORC90169.1 hypothetical protein TM35_000092190 [Trypanosoma theileri]
MPSVDVDVTTIPDMIEAQLTLSYSRLANLVRLIVDQGNGHDIDIDKLTNRIDALTRENAELRKLVESLISEKKSEDAIREELAELRQELSRVSDASAENSKKMSSVVEMIHQQNDDLEQRVNEESKVRTNEMDQVQTSLRELEEFNAVTRNTMKLFDEFIALWEGKGDKVELLTKCGPDGSFQHSTDERVSYLHSLPVFTKVFDEMDVLRQMMRQQASDALLAKNATLNKRASAIESISSPAAGTIDREAIDALQDSFSALEKRIRNLETRRIPALEEAQRQQQQDQQEQQQMDQTASRVDRDEIKKVDDRLQHVENRLRNLTFQASEGSTIDKAVLMDMEIRLRSLEETVEGIPSGPAVNNNQQQQQQQGQKGDADSLPPIFSVQRPSSANLRPSQLRPQSASTRRISAPPTDDGSSIKAEGERAATPLADTRPASGLNAAGDERNKQRMSATVGSLGSRHSVRSSVEQPNVEVYRKQSVSSPKSANSVPQVQVLEQDDGLRRRVAQLEENSAILEMKKADRNELLALEESLRHYLTNAGIPISSHMVQGMMAQYPGAANDGRMAYVTEASYANNAPGMQRSTPIGRPMFVGSSSQYLRDATGNMTCATIASAHAQ